MAAAQSSVPGHAGEAMTRVPGAPTSSISAGPPAAPPPLQAARAQQAPESRTKKKKAERNESGRAQSPRTLTPGCSWSATAWPASRLREQRTTSAPACASARTVSTPMPLLPPARGGGGCMAWKAVEASVACCRRRCRVLAPTSRAAQPTGTGNRAQVARQWVAALSASDTARHRGQGWVSKELVDGSGTGDGQRGDQQKAPLPGCKLTRDNGLLSGQICTPQGLYGSRPVAQLATGWWCLAVCSLGHGAVKPCNR